MTPTLYGRWQTRIFLLMTIGVIVTLPFALGYIGIGTSGIYFWVLFYAGIFGLTWDILYNWLQKFFWDHDWPGVVQFCACIVEGILLSLLIQLNLLPNIPQPEFNLQWFVIHYSTVSIFAYLTAWVIMRLFFPRWRFRGGVWMGRWGKT
ncbi:MAG: hypothetical protein HC785_18530 [Calothrix sp. CSU_2_0]|nr:hypothetical protein [Calothrix sp. CSU_2_0]